MRYFVHRRNQRALTFLEVMIVIVILGVVLAITLPNMRAPRETAALRGAARNIASAGMLARQLAISQGEKTFMILNKESNEWRIFVTPPPEDERDRRDYYEDEEREPTSPEERVRELPKFISFANFMKPNEEVDTTFDDEPVELTFYPNGSCTGLAIHLKSERGKSLTVDFARSTGRPEVYDGEPKSMAEKLIAKGIDPTEYGLENPNAEIPPEDRPGAGFERTAGFTEEERVDYYKDIADRLKERSRAKYEMRKEGAAAYYRESARWGQ